AFRAEAEMVPLGEGRKGQAPKARRYLGEIDEFSPQVSGRSAVGLSGGRALRSAFAWRRVQELGRPDRCNFRTRANRARCQGFGGRCHVLFRGSPMALLVRL